MFHLIKTISILRETYIPIRKGPLKETNKHFDKVVNISIKKIGDVLLKISISLIVGTLVIDNSPKPIDC